MSKNPLDVELNDRIKVRGHARHYVVTDFNLETDELWLEDRKGRKYKNKISHVERIVDFKGGFLNY